ncbi:MAG: Grx4 family monothiol glutaredoxin [Pseudomonadota bacterium]
MTTTDAQNPGQDVQDWIRRTVNSHDVVLFMKGTQQFPQCGFSAQVAQIMALLDVDAKDFNVLEDMSVREGVKQFSNWPTIPQLYIKGEFVGGCDIVREMYEAGELQDHLAKQGISFNKSTAVA